MAGKKRMLEDLLENLKTSISTGEKREILRKTRTNLELEIRLQEVDYETFSSIYRKLLAGNLPNHDTKIMGLTQMISAIRETPEKGLKPTYIREIFFSRGKKSEEKYVRKTPKGPPYKVFTDSIIPYKIALSSEEHIKKRDFPIANGSTILRLKSRVSFLLNFCGSSESRWRIDLTIVRRVVDKTSSGETLQLINQLFKTDEVATPINLLKVLDLENSDNAYREKFIYEVEAELLRETDETVETSVGDVETLASWLIGLADSDTLKEKEYQTEIFKVAKYMIDIPSFLQKFKWKYGLKKLLPQVEALTRVKYHGLYPPRNWFLTDKADGIRALAVVDSSGGFVIADKLLRFGQKAQFPGNAGDTILDGEWVYPEKGLPDQGRFFAFDVLLLRGEKIMSERFDKRMEALPEGVSILTSKGVPAEAKAYVHLVSANPSGLESQIKGFLERSPPYKVDGLIFVEPGKIYSETISYKWKSAENNTIDFFVRKAPDGTPFEARPSHTLYFLFVGISPDLYSFSRLQPCPGYADLFGGLGSMEEGYFPIQFAPSDKPLAYLYYHPDASPMKDIEGRIVEARYIDSEKSEDKVWEIVRIRTDRERDLRSKRYFGNDFRTAEIVWLNYLDPFPMAQLWEGPSSTYFQGRKESIHKSQTTFTSIVKSLRISTLAHADWIIDLGSGKGQDLGRYFSAGIRNLVAVDRDKGALSELIRKKYNLFGGKRRGNDRKASSFSDKISTTLYVLVADLGAPYSSTLKGFQELGVPPSGCDAIVCNLAIHYFLNSMESLRNIATLISGSLRAGGSAILTIMSGSAVHDLFIREKVGVGESWDVHEDGALKFSIRRLYSSDILENVGQKIELILPFSCGEYYEEFLVNEEILSEEFRSRGLLLNRTESKSLIEKQDQVFSHKRDLLKSLTLDDKKYLSLYRELIYEKIP